jgi:hypothetical protein
VVQTGFMKLNTELETASKCVPPSFCPLKLSLTPVNQTKILVTNEGYCVIIGTNILVIRSDMKKYSVGGGRGYILRGDWRVLIYEVLCLASVVASDC